jgi:nucleoside-diphosphate-sugar epimerase
MPPPVTWDASAGEPRQDALAGCDAVLHLAGESISQRWTAEAKIRIRESRVNGTRHLAQALSKLPVRSNSCPGTTSAWAASSTAKRNASPGHPRQAAAGSAAPTGSPTATRPEAPQTESAAPAPKTPFSGPLSPPSPDPEQRAAPVPRLQQSGTAARGESHPHKRGNGTPPLAP